MHLVLGWPGLCLIRHQIEGYFGSTDKTAFLDRQALFSWPQILNYWILTLSHAGTVFPRIGNDRSILHRVPRLQRYLQGTMVPQTMTGRPFSGDPSAYHFILQLPETGHNS